MVNAPATDVLRAFEQGAGSLHEAATMTGHSLDLVSAVVDELVRLGRLDAQVISSGCPSSGCGTCASGVDGSPGCGAEQASTQRRGPVLIALSVRRR